MRWRDVALMALAVVSLVALAVGFFWWLTGVSDGKAGKPSVSLRTPEPTLRRALLVWGRGAGVDVAEWQRVAAKFTAETGEDVQFQIWEDDASYAQTLDTGWGGENRPDVVLVAAEDVERLRRAALIAEVPWSPAEVPRWVGSVIQPLLQGPDKIVGYPADFSVLALYYNKAIFDRQGLAYPGDHWNWETLIAISRAVFQPAEGVRPVSWGLEAPLTLELWQALATQAGGGVYHEGRWLVSQPKAESGAAKGLQHLMRLFQDFAFATPRRSADTAFERGQSALLVAGAEMAARLSRQSKVSWGVAMLPKQDFQATTMDFHLWTVAASSRQQHLAQRLARLLAETPSRNDWMPAYQPEGVKKGDDPPGIFYQAVETAQPPFLHRTAPWVKQTVNGVLARIPQGPETEAVVLMQAINAALEKRDEWAKRD